MLVLAAHLLKLEWCINTMFAKFTHVFACSITSFIFMARTNLYIPHFCFCNMFIFYWPLGYSIFGLFYILLLWTFLWLLGTHTYAFSVGHISRKAVAGSWAICMFSCKNTALVCHFSTLSSSVWKLSSTTLDIRSH